MRKDQLMLIRLMLEPLPYDYNLNIDEVNSIIYSNPEYIISLVRYMENICLKEIVKNKLKTTGGNTKC